MDTYSKLMNIQQELKAPKGQYNNFGKYRYRSCEDILEAVKPLLGKYEAVLYISDKVELIGDRHYITATATFVDIQDGTSISVTAQAREEADKKGMDGSQITGAASSYARKYALNGLFCIDDTKDSDATNTGEDKGSVSDLLVCSDCKQPITPYKGRTAEDLFNGSMERFGRPLCAKCSIKIGQSEQ